MGFVAHPTPDHIWHPVLGWLTPEQVQGDPALSELQFSDAAVSAALNATSIEGGVMLGPEPQADYPHHVEIDCSTGIIGYTRLTDQELADMLAAPPASASEVST